MRPARRPGRRYVREVFAATDACGTDGDSPESAAVRAPRAHRDQAARGPGSGTPPVALVARADAAWTATEEPPSPDVRCLVALRTCRRHHPSSRGPSGRCG